jgi:hypothetical protein
VNITIVDDGTAEGSEEFELTLSVDDEPSVTTAPERAVVSIVDNDGESVVHTKV